MNQAGSEGAPAAERAPLVATCSLGTEPALIAELKALGMKGVRGQRGAVRFHGNLEHGMRACLHVRSGMRILLPLATFPAADADALYAGARAIPWWDHMDTRHTFAVEATGMSETLRHTGFTALKVKDAIADALRDKRGARPNVDPRNPDVPVVVHLSRGEASVHLDLCGRPLHMRGYRPPGAPAPLRETLAAALLLMAGYDGTLPFWDPMCGSGTLVVEAAWMAQKRAPGLGRSFAFERWPGFAGTLQSRWHRMVHEARAAVISDIPAMRAGDFSDKALELLMQTLRLAGLEGKVRTAREEVRRARPEGTPGVVVTNPPWAERMGKALQVQGLYRGMGEAMNTWEGWKICVFTGLERFESHFGHRALGRQNLRNGPLECALFNMGTAPFGAARE